MPEQPAGYDNPTVLAANGKSPRDPDAPEGITTSDGQQEVVNGFGQVAHAGIVKPRHR